MNRHPDLTPVLATPYGWIAALPIAVFIILPVIVLPTHPIPCPADRWATPEAYGHERLGERQPVHVHRHPVGDPVQHLGALGRRRLSQAGAAACAASRARSTSSAVPRATSQNAWPVIGVGFSKYCPPAGGTASPPIQCSYRD